MPCHTNCKICTGPNNYQCSACNTGFYLNSDTNTCAETCPDGYHENTGEVCTRCTAPCDFCEGGLLVCTKCRAGTYMFTGLNTCDSDCSLYSTFNYYGDDATLKCL